MSLPIYFSSCSCPSQDSAPASWGASTAQHSMNEVPALAGTLLRLELLMKQPSIDLEAIARLVRSDIGLTLQAIHHSRSGEDGADGCWRISDCVMLLADELLEIALPFQSVTDNRSYSYPEAEAFWKYCELVATVAEKTAVYFHELDVNPEQAYISGLLHKVTRLPWVLGIADPSSSESSFNVQEWLMKWNLPPFLSEAIVTEQDARPLYGASALFRIVSFARLWIDMCLPWSETCMARRTRFNLPVLRSANLIYRFFPGTEADPLVPFMEMLKECVLEKLEEQRPESSSILLNTRAMAPRIDISILQARENASLDSETNLHSIESGRII